MAVRSLYVAVEIVVVVGGTRLNILVIVVASLVTKTAKPRKPQAPLLPTI